eukprot:s267_g35.t1
MSAGKTEAVLMFRGPGSNACRTQLFDTTAPPCLVVSTSTHVLTLRVVASYKHLGARFSMNADMELEVKSRAASARQAFEEVKKAIFLNSRIPTAARVQLYSSLVLSRLLYSCSTWADLTTGQLSHLDSLVTGHLRRIHNDGFWQPTQTNDHDFYKQHLLLPFRILWARHRLVFLHHIACHGHSFHIDLLLAEFSFGQGWLHEICEDLLAACSADWHQTWTVLRTCSTWKALATVAELRLAGIEILDGEPAPVSTPESQPFECGECSARFSTHQQLAVHASKKHGVDSVERSLVQSTARSRSASSLADAAVLLRTAGGACGSRPCRGMSAEVSGEAEGVTLIEAIEAGRIATPGELSFPHWQAWRRGPGMRPT